MTLQVETYSRTQRYTTVPTVLIQDPSKNEGYLIEDFNMQEFVTTPAVWATMRPNTVTFTIPDDSIIQRVPPFSRSTTDQPDVLIQWDSGQQSYLIPATELHRFAVPLGRERGDGYDVSFIIPRGTELIEELPALRASMLQSGQRTAD